MHGTPTDDEQKRDKMMLRNEAEIFTAQRIAIAQTRKLCTDMIAPNPTQEERIAELQKEIARLRERAERRTAVELRIDPFHNGAFADYPVFSEAHDRLPLDAVGSLHVDGSYVSYRAPGDDNFGNSVPILCDGEYRIVSRSADLFIQAWFDVSDVNRQLGPCERMVRWIKSHEPPTKGAAQ